jgi:hypothetical protein
MIEVTADAAALRRALLLTGVAGVLGAAIMLIGDLLLYAHFDPLPPVAEPVQASLGPRVAILLATPTQLAVSTLLGPVAALFYVLGAWHVYARMQVPQNSRWAQLAGALWALTFMFSGAYHALWGPFGLIAQLANVQSPLPLFMQAESIMQLMLGASTLVALPLMVLMLVRVGTGRTDYPRWTALYNPLLLYGVGVPLLTPLAATLPAPYGAVLLGGLYNALMLGFFSLSVLTLPSRGHVTT